MTTKLKTDKTTPTIKKPVVVKAPKVKGPKKLDVAVGFYNEIHATLTANGKELVRKDFRAAVIARLKKELGIANAGTLGMYFAQADQTVNKRQVKHYNITAPRKTRKAVVRAAHNAANNASESELNALLNSVAAPVKSAKSTTKLVAPASLVSSL